MTKSIQKRICAVLSATMLCFTFYISNITLAQAESVDYSVISAYDNTPIEDDLSDLNIDLYPKAEGANAKIIRFSEYCFTQKGLLKDYYGLYFYVYNPSERPIYEYGNVVNMATSYDEEGKPIAYENVKLTLLDGADEKDVKPNRFYKFKIEKDEVRSSLYDMAYKYSLANNGERRYDIAGIQLTYKDGNQAMDYSYGKTYYMSGYSKGFGASEESTLEARSSTLETIKLDVKHTYYRTDDYKDYVCDELNTVYFSVPQNYLEKYGKLQKIKAEWYENKTSPMFVTSDENAYNALKPYIGKDIGGNRYDDLAWRVLWEETKYDNSSLVAGSSIQYKWDKSFNPLTDGESFYYLLNTYYMWGDSEYITRFDWLFNREDVYEKEDYGVSREEVKAYMEEYTASHSNQAKLNGYAQNLFTESIDEDRIKLLSEPKDKRGHIVQEIDAGETDELRFEADNSWWDKLWNGVQYEGKPYSPIVQLTSADLSGLNADSFAKQYYVDEKEAEKVLNDCRDIVSAGGTAVLFRFAQTDYYASPARFDKDGNATVSEVDGYVAQETVFLDFDIISLTFRSELEGDTVIAAVSNPIDIINGLDAPPGNYDYDNDWLSELKEILTMIGIAIAVLVVAVICAPLLPYVFKGIIWIILAPFKGVAWVVKQIVGKLKKE